MVRSKRLEEIKKIILSETITNQEFLLNKLFERGISITQATLSRDIKLLKIAKLPLSDGTFAYSLPDRSNLHMNNDSKASNFITDVGLINIDFSGNMGVLKTLPGYAMAVAAEIDKRLKNYILGTVAGDDTIFVVLKQGIKPKEIIKELKIFTTKLAKDENI